MLKVLPPVTAYTDFERMIKPAVHHFVRAMDGRFAGNAVLESTIQFFAELTWYSDAREIAQKLYTPKRGEPCSCCSELPTALNIEVV